MLKTLRAILAVLAIGGATSVAARPYAIDDLLHQEAFGSEALDPSGRWFVFERTDPYDTATRYDNDAYNSAAISRLMVVDLSKPGPAHPLLNRTVPRGQLLTSFSPSGARLAICRFDGGSYVLGVVDMASGAVRWFDDITPEAYFARGLQWLSDTELAVINRPDGSPVYLMRLGSASARRLPGRWEATATGEGAHTVYGSGAYAGLREKASPQQLLRLNVVTGARRVLATGAFFDLEVSPDHARAALLETGNSIQSKPGLPAQGDLGIETETSRLSIVDLKTGARLDPCPRCDTLPSLLTWSPSGRSLLVFTRRPGALWTDGVLQAIDAAAGTIWPVGAGLTPQFVVRRPMTVAAGWMGEDPIYLAKPKGSLEARFDWLRLGPSGPVNLTARLSSGAGNVVASDRRSLTLLAADGLWRALANGSVRRLPAQNPTRVRPPGLQSADRLYNVPPEGSWLATGVGATRKVRWIDGRGLHDGVDLPADAAPVVAISPSMQSLVVSDRDDHGVESLTLRRAGVAPLDLADVNVRLAEVDVTHILPVVHKGPDGQDLTSWLLLPPRPPGSPPPPLVIRPYSGQSFRTPPHDYANERSFVGNYRALVGHGYAVLVPSLPLPRQRTDPMPGLADRILEVVAAAAKGPSTAGAFDPDRLALVGHSYGGYTVMAAIGQSDRFRAAISMAGLSDMFAKWHTLASIHRVLSEEGAQFNWESGSVEDGQGEMFNPPWVDPARYARNSPMYAVDKIKTPLLLFHGDQDVVTIQQSDAMFAALYRQGKDAISVTYWGEGHLLDSPGNVRDMYARSFAFLDEHLALPSHDAAPPSANPERGPANGAPKPPPPKS